MADSVDYSKFKNLTDENVVALGANGDVEAVEYILNKYKPLVRARANVYFIAGADRDDILQEGMIGLYKAIKDYKDVFDTSFKAFADLCVKRQIITAVKAATRQKHLPLNSYVSLNKSAFEDDSDRTVMDFIDAEAMLNPEDIIIGKEDVKNIEAIIERMLSEFEIRVLKQYLSGRGYQEVARILNKSPKSIDNALQRIKRKLECELLDSSQYNRA